ncbi:Ig-like domain-containing protein [Salinigranum salinum]|uniref:Ig-like domain-containing protein n=1 Tax=Salinigranum salinum TaxID=1364937 RepID=UPI00126040A2|nr:Ig-like domain-containing protein [Salinigranum salinum]
MDQTETPIGRTRTDRRTARRPRRDTPRRRFERTDRGQTELLGGILLFGLVVALVVLIQVAAVPSWNQALEFEHSQRVDGDFQRLGQIMSDVAGDGGDRSATVEVGMRYPTRPFLFNPPPATGRLETSEPGTLYINNSEISGVDNYWNDGSESFQTRTIRYDASYNEYRNDPAITYEYGLLVETHPSGVERPTRTIPVVNGTNVNLVLVDGRLQDTRAGTVTVPIEGVSAPSTGVKLRNRTDGDIVIRLPTESSQAVWDEALKNEIDSGGDSDPDKHVESVTVSDGEVVIRLERDETYNLRMAAVGVGSALPDERAAYITTKGDSTKIFANETRNELTAVVRDRYNNPVSGVEVEFRSDDATCGSFDSSPPDVTRATTGEDGEATVDIDMGPEQCEVDVTADIVGGSGPSDTATFEIRATTGAIVTIGSPGDGDGGAEDGVSELNPESGVPIYTGIAQSTSGGDFDVCMYNPTGETYTFLEGRISFYFTSGSNAPTTVAFTDVSGLSPQPLPGPFVDIQGLGDVSSDADAQSRIALDFEDKDSGPSDFFVLSIRYQVGSETDTFSYLVSPPDNNNYGDCPAPPT